MTAHPLTAHRITVVVATLILTALPAAAQDRPSPTLELAAGWVGFADDGIVSEFLVGGGFRWYLSPRISIGPEVTFIAGESHSHQVVTGNLTFDVLAPRNGGSRVTPFIVVGGGMFRTGEDFANGPYSSIEGAFTAGGGIRAPIGERVAAGIDARLGWEPHLRLTGFVSVGLGGRP